MSDELDAAIDRANAPQEAVQYVEMSDAYHQEPKDERPEYNSQADGLRAAASEVDKKREESEPTVRQYNQYGG